MWKVLALGKPLSWEKSIVGFAEQRGDLLAKFMGSNYIIRLVFRILTKIGFRVGKSKKTLAIALYCWLLISCGVLH